MKYLLIHTLDKKKFFFRFEDIAYLMRPATGRMHIIRERRRHRPQIPERIHELNNTLAGYPAVEPIFRGEVQGEDGSIAIIFANRQMLSRVNNAIELHIDGTFKVST